jgi:hypothetical protein
LKRYADAMDKFERLILLDPRHASAYNAGNRKSAIHDHRVLLTLNRDLAKKLYEAINK